MLSLKVTAVGSSTGIILPREAIVRLGVKSGDTLLLTGTPGGYRLTPQIPVTPKVIPPYKIPSKRR